jgi:hypothetical protein
MKQSPSQWARRRSECEGKGEGEGGDGDGDGSDEAKALECWLTTAAAAAAAVSAKLSWWEEAQTWGSFGCRTRVVIGWTGGVSRVCSDMST